MAIYDGARGSLTYSCAGHPTPLVFGPAPDALAPVPHLAPPVGAGADSGLRQTMISLPPDSTACLFSDGVRWQPESPTAIDRKALAAVEDAEEPDAEALLEVARAGRGELRAT